MARVTLTLTPGVGSSVTDQPLLPSCSAADRPSGGITLTSVRAIMIEQPSKRNSSSLSRCTRRGVGKGTLEGPFPYKDIYHRQADLFYAQETPRRPPNKRLEGMKYSCRVKYGS